MGSDGQRGPLGRSLGGNVAATLGRESLEAEPRGGEETPKQPGQPNRVRGRAQGMRHLEGKQGSSIAENLLCCISLKTTLFLIPKLPAGFSCCVVLCCVGLP